MSTRTRGLLLGVAVSAAATAWLLSTTDLSGAFANLAWAEVPWLAPAQLVIAVQACVRAYRWAFVLRASSGRALGTLRVLDAMLVGYFVNAVMPGRLGEVARSLVVSRREQLPFGGVAATVLVERAIDVMSLAVLVAIALALSGSSGAIVFAAAALGIAVLLVLGRRAPAFERLLPSRTPARIADGVRSFLRAIAAIPLPVAAGAAGLSVVAWFGDALIVLFVAKAFAIEIPIAGAVAIALGGALGTALPAAPGYIATYELGAVALGSLAGVPRETVLPIAIVAHLIGVTLLAAAGGIALGRVGSLIQLDRLTRGAEMNLAAEER